MKHDLGHRHSQRPARHAYHRHRGTFAYLAGNLTLRYDEQLAFVGEWLSAADLAGGVPLRHSVGVEFTGAMGENQPLFLGGAAAATLRTPGWWAAGWVWTSHRSACTAS
ncbi:MAG: hypothetical protein R3A10_09380 [Caldilineaceae bacterium]